MIGLLSTVDQMSVSGKAQVIGSHVAWWVVVCEIAVVSSNATISNATISKATSISGPLGPPCDRFRDRLAAERDHCSSLPRIT